MPINYDRVPEHMREGIRHYIEDGRPPGGFLRALLSNDFMETVGRADSINREALREWARFLYNEVPSNCHGSPKVVEAWIKRGGLNGGCIDAP